LKSRIASAVAVHGTDGQHSPELARLRAEIADRPVRTWAEYADDLWTYLVRGEGAA